MSPAGTRAIAWWLWPTVLSLDAPLVVLGWQAAVAHVAGVRLDSSQPFILAASVWLAYAADRWIEVWRLPADAIRTERHAFYQRRRWTVFPLWIGVLSVDLWLAMTRLSASELRAGWLVVPPVLAYLLSHQLVHRDHPWRVPKEACVALLLGGGVGVFPLAHGASHRHLWPTLLLFVLLCFANCVLISVWEREVDRSHGQTSLALQFGSDAWIHALPWIVSGLALTFGLLAAGDARAAGACAAGSALLLGLLDHFHPRLGPRGSRVLADVALLTPFVAMLFGRLA